MKKNKIAITGAGGFIGAHLVKRYLNAGEKVIAIDNFMRGDESRLPKNHRNLTTVKSDIRFATKDLKLGLHSAHTVFHLAAINGTENFYTKPDLVLDVGVRGIMTVMDVCKEAGVKNLIVASSAEVYQTPNIIPTPEDVALTLPNSVNPRYSYGGSKILTELVAMNYHREFFNKLMIFRPHNVYGPDMGTKHVIPQLILKVLALKNKSNKKGLEIKGSPDSSRAFAYIDDVINGLSLMAESGEHREIYHIGNDVECTIQDLARQIMQIANVKTSIFTGDAFEGETLRRCPSIEKIKSIGYIPKVALPVGLKNTFDWYEKKFLFSKNELM